MAWRLTLGVQSMVCAPGGLARHRLFQPTQRFPCHKWFIGSFSCQWKQFHNSPVRRNLTNITPLLDQTRKSLLKLRSRDNVPKDCMLIYKAPLELSLRVAYLAVLGCVVGMVWLVFYKKYNKVNIDNRKESGKGGQIKIINPEAEVLFFSSVITLTAMAIYSIIFKYPFRVYKHREKKEYIAMYISAIPIMMRQFHFRSATKTKFKNPLYLCVPDSHYILDGKKRSFLLINFFRIPKDLTDMMEEDKNVG